MDGAADRDLSQNNSPESDGELPQGAPSTIAEPEPVEDAPRPTGTGETRILALTRRVSPALRPQARWDNQTAETVGELVRDLERWGFRFSVGRRGTLHVEYAATFALLRRYARAILQLKNRRRNGPARTTRSKKWPSNKRT
jgi:hypothetical protein